MGENPYEAPQAAPGIVADRPDSGPAIRYAMRLGLWSLTGFFVGLTAMLLALRWLIDTYLLNGNQ